MNLPPITIAEARQLAIRARTLGDRIWEPKSDDDLVTIMDLVASALVALDDYARQLETTMVEQHDSINELTETIDRYLARDTHPSSQPGPGGEITGVHWQGDAMTYAQNMEMINKGLASEISAAFGGRGKVIEVDFRPNGDHSA